MKIAIYSFYITQIQLWKCKTLFHSIIYKIFDLLASINPFVPNAPFLSPLKKSENQVFWCFQVVEVERFRNKWVKNEDELFVVSFRFKICWFIPPQIFHHGKRMETAISRYFRPKLVHWNESVYCTPIDRALKMRFSEGSGSILQLTIPELWRFLRNQLRRCLDKINT